MLRETENKLYLAEPGVTISSTTKRQINTHENSVTRIETYHKKFVGALKTVKSEA